MMSMRITCRDCNGSGEGEGMAGSGPDTYGVSIQCKKCSGTGETTVELPQQVPLDPEFAKVLSDNLDSLYVEDKPAQPSAEPPYPVKTAPMPNPTEQDLADPVFEAIWQVTKTWDVNSPEYYEGYCGLNGSHVKVILDAVRGVAAQPRAEPVETVGTQLIGVIADLWTKNPDMSIRQTLDALNAMFPTQSAQPSTTPVYHGTEFVKRTNREYREWCATYYVPEALDERGMKSLDGLWAWQEQERRKMGMGKP